jgi:hypothetical protein
MKNFNKNVINVNCNDNFIIILAPLGLKQCGSQVLRIGDSWMLLGMFTTKRIANLLSLSICTHVHMDHDHDHHQ